jgi:hypothetical protein
VNGGEVYPTAVRAEDKDNAQLALELPSEPPQRQISYVFGGSDQSEMGDTVSAISPYRDQVVTTAKSTGFERAERGDPEGFAGAVQAIRDAAEQYGEFTSDDLNWSLRGGEVGAAFAHLRRLGEIEVCGHATSKRQLSHGRLLRVWRQR